MHRPKITIISSLVYDTTFPLVKNLSNFGYSIDLFCFISKTFLTMPVFDLSATLPKSSHGYINSKSAFKYLPKHIFKYFDESHVKIHLVVLSGGKNFFKDFIFLRNFSKKFKNVKKLHVIGENVYFPILMSGLYDKIIAQTFHENLTRVKKNKSPLKNLLYNYYYKKIISSNAKIILHSKNVYNLFIEDFPKITPSRLKIIPFGMSDIYKFIDADNSILDGKKNFFLFFGYINYYKGVDILLKSINLLGSENLNFIIAGRDSIGYKIDDNLSNILFINKFLTESEIISLVKNSYAIVMPYRSASQSGIPKTAFLFEKPIICSNIEGLDEVLIDKHNCIKYESLNHKELSEKIKLLNTDLELYDMLKKNIIKNNKIDKYNWKNYIVKYQSIYNS